MLRRAQGNPARAGYEDYRPMKASPGWTFQSDSSFAFEPLGKSDAA
jgi:hypothetical protein